MRKHLFLFLIVQFGFMLKTFSQVNVTSSSGPGASPYATLKAAFDAINAGTLTGTINISITGSTIETASAVLNSGATAPASYTSITISPSGGAWTISGSLAAPLIDLNGADNVMIDGLNTGGNALTISNTSTASTAGTSTIRFQNDATSDTITNCSILGSATVTSVTTVAATIIFHTTTGTAGNDNNAITYCNIGPAGASLPAKMIHSIGTTTTAAQYNNGITIANNNIYDFFFAGGATGGIFLGNANADWNISSNRFFQTAARSQTATGIHAPIYISGATGNTNHSITGNIIGYSSAAGTGTYTINSSASSQFVGIYYGSVSSGAAASIQGNLITNIALTGPFTGTTSTAAFIGISLTASSANVGTITPNTIGSLSANGAITVTSSATSTSEAIGIYAGSSTSLNIASNNIGGITANNSSTGPANVTGIRTSTGTASYTISSNNIGGYLPGSLQSLTAATGSQVFGIHVSGPAMTLTNNTIRHMSAAGGTGTTSGASLIGIMINAASTNHTITGNTVYGLNNTHISAVTTVTGLYFNSSNGSNTISANVIHSLNAASTAGLINGIYTNGGTATYSNNMIRLGIDSTGANITNSVGIYGVYENAGTNNFYHNSVFVGGTGVATNLTNTYAFLSTVTTNTRNYINNIFVNVRSNVSGTGKHYAVRVGGTVANPAGLTMSNNVFFVNGTGGTFGFFNSADVSSLGLWQLYVGGNGNSAFADPQFVAPLGTSSTVDLHISTLVASPVENTGAVLAAVTKDFDGNNRSASTPDIGADEGGFLPMDAIAPVITYTKLLHDVSLTTRVVNNFATITDLSGINTTAGTRPRIYYKKYSENNAFNGNTSGDNGWKFVEASNTTSPFSFSIDYTLLFGGFVTVGDTIQYFVVAQDLAAVPNVQSNVGGFSVPASGVALTAAQFPVLGTINTYRIVNAPLNGIINVGTGFTYTTLTDAVNDLALRGINGPVTLNLTDAIYTTPAETFPINFGGIGGVSSTNTITVIPAGSATISGSSATSIIDLNGASFVTFEGRMAGTGLNKDLVIENTLTTATSTVRFINDASKNKIQYCVIKGVATGASSGTVLFAGTNGVLGNDSNTIDNCDIKNGLSRPIQGIYASGSTGSAVLYNDNNVISNNNIYNFFNATAASSGIKVDAGNAGWQILNNSLYDTASITYTSTVTHHAIFINAVASSTTNGSGFSVTGNFIGGSAPGATGAPYTWTSTGTATSTIYMGIEMLAGMGAPSVIQNNTITNMNITTSSSGAAFMGINIERGVINMTDNMIGSATNPTSMVFTANTTGGSFYGLRMGTTSGGMGITNISNNTICGIEIKGSTAAIIANFTGIASSGGTTTNITGNTIGSATLTNAINASTAFTLTTANHVVRAIIGNSASTTYNINGNLIANINTNSVAGGTTNSHNIFGIIYSPGSANANPVSISNNIIRDLTNSSQTISSSPNAAITGIVVSTTANVTGVLSINNNQIYGLKLTGTATSASVGIRGIYIAGGGAGSAVSNNRIHGFSVSAANPAAVIMAIETGGGIVNYYNNFISLGVDANGTDENTGYLITAINDALGSNSFYHNSVYIGGQSVNSGSASTYAFYSSVTTNTRSFINNSFYNARSNGAATGKHYAVRLAGTTVNPAGLTMNNNLMYAPGMGGVFGFYNGADVADLTAWTTAVGQNAGSLMGNPLYALPNGSSATVDLAPAIGSPLQNAGVPVALVTTDIIGKPRSATTPTIGAGETNSSLPVELVLFTATKQQNGVILNWATSSEISNDFFVVQRSVDGKTFSTIGQVKGNGTTNHFNAYTYVDAKIPSGVSTIYYRLVQVDFNRKQSVSNIVVVEFDHAQAEAKMQINPNPFNALADIRIDMNTASTGTMRVLDMQGKTVLEKTVVLEEGINHILFDELNSSSYQGMYFIYLVTPEATFVEKAIKTN